MDSKGRLIYQFRNKRYFRTLSMRQRIHLMSFCFTFSSDWYEEILQKSSIFSHQILFTISIKSIVITAMCTHWILSHSDIISKINFVFIEPDEKKAWWSIRKSKRRMVSLFRIWFHYDNIQKRKISRYRNINWRMIRLFYQ